MKQKAEILPVEEDKISADAWSWNSHSPDAWPSPRSLTSADLAAMTAQFLAMGGEVRQIPTGESGIHLSCETVVYETEAGNRQQITRFVDKDMTQRAINERRYSHAEKTAARMLANGHNTKTIAQAVGFSESHVQGIIKAMRERAE